MSLYIGNLSTRTHRDDLERVFRRYGRNKVQLKDGYGFVVYDFRPDAEKALRALQGRTICGEPLTLTWSNKQPKPFQRFARGARPYEAQHGRNSAREGHYVNRKITSNFRRLYNTNIKQQENTGGKLISAIMLDEETSYHQDDVNNFIGEEFHDYREDLLIEGGSVEKPNPVDNGRWGEQLHDPSNDRGVENGREFSHYKTYKGYDRTEKDENHQVAYSGDSPALTTSQEKTGGEQIGELPMDHPNDSKPQQTCYNCGSLGCKRRDCPRENASRRKFPRSGQRQDCDLNTSRGEGKLKKIRSKSKEKLQLSRDAISISQHETDRKASGSGKHRTLIRHGSSPIRNETDRARRKDSEAKKQSRREIGTPTKHSAKKARLVSSPLHSDYTASRSPSISRSPKCVQRSSSHLRSRSVSSRALSYSSNSRSTSTLNHSRSRTSKSRSSSPTSLSLSVSLGCSLPFSPNKVQLNLKSSLDIASSPESKEILVEQGKFVGGDVSLVNSKLQNTIATCDQVVIVEQGQPVEANVGLVNTKLNNAMVSLNYESALSSSNVMEKDRPSQRDEDEDRIMRKSSHEVTNACTTLSDKGMSTSSLLQESLTETREFHNSGELVEHIPKLNKKLDSEVTVCSGSGNSTSICSEELYMVLKHYDMELPEENESHLPAEAYFGSARLWPWEIIHYRGLKKGLISTQNYARRVAQNREFRIVDKYIRSSSGWGELSQDNP